MGKVLEKKKQAHWGSLVTFGVLVFVILYLHVPPFQEWVNYTLIRGKQWASYVKWRAAFESRPSWIQEMLQVRGKGP